MLGVFNVVDDICFSSALLAIYEKRQSLLVTLFVNDLIDCSLASIDCVNDYTKNMTETRSIVSATSSLDHPNGTRIDDVDDFELQQSLQNLE